MESCRTTECDIKPREFQLNGMYFVGTKSIVILGKLMELFFCIQIGKDAILRLIVIGSLMARTLAMEVNVYDTTFIYFLMFVCI